MKRGDHVMEDLKDYIEERLSDIEETYDFYLEKLDKTYDHQEQLQFENRLRDLRIERTTLKDILEKMGEENENLASSKEH